MNLDQKENKFLQIDGKMSEKIENDIIVRYSPFKFPHLVIFYELFVLLVKKFYKL